MIAACDRKDYNIRIVFGSFESLSSSNFMIYTLYDKTVLQFITFSLF